MIVPVIFKILAITAVTAKASPSLEQMVKIERQYSTLQLRLLTYCTL